MKRLIVVLSLLITASMILAACQPAPVEAPEPEVIYETVVVEGTPQVVIATPEPTEEPEPMQEPKVLNLAWGPGDIPTIDPALAWDVISIQIIDETTVGLVRQNELTAELENAMATDIQVSDDGLTYTFTVRDDVPWVRYDGKEVKQVMDCEGNPRMVTAQDFAYGILRTADPATAADYAYVLGFVVEGVNAFNSGETDDPSTVGVRAIDDTTLEIQFREPAVYNLNIAGLWFAHAMPSWIIEGDDCTEGVGERWIETGFFQGYGPFTLKEWVHDAHLTLVKNPFWPGDDVVPTPKLDEITWRFLDASPALAEFEAGNLHVSAIPSGDFDRIHTDPELSKLISNTYTIGTEFYSFNTKLEPTDDVRVRMALSKAIDREALMAAVTKTGVPAPFFTHPGAAGAPKMEQYPDLGVFYDPEGAQALLQEYLDEKGITAEELEIVMMFNTAESHKKRAEAVQQMWKDVLGIDVQLTNQEWSVFKVSRNTGLENIYRSSWVQDYPDANNFLFEVFGPNGAYQTVVNWPFDEEVADSGEDATFDQFVDLCRQAAVETDADARAALYAQAEQILVQDQAVITPLHWYSGEVLIRPEVIFTQSITGYDRYEKWDLQQ